MTTTETSPRMISCKELGVDVETYSETEIKNGAYAYADAPTFEIILIAYSLDGGPPKSFMPRRFRERPGVLSPAGEPGEQMTFLEAPEFETTGDEDEFLALLSSPEVIKTAYNANFERTTLASYYNIKCPPDEWRCTAVLASTLGLPRSLEAAGAAMGLPEDKQKLKTGKALIQYFCKPCKPTNKNGGRRRNYPQHDVEKWKLFIEYNLQDVTTEQAILAALRKFRPIPKEQALWSVDQEICDRGIRIDVPFVEGIVKYDAERQQALKDEARQITGLENPNSLQQLSTWMASEGVGSVSLDKAAVLELLTRDLPPDVRRVLQIRQSLGKTSTKKYQAMLDSVCHDGRVRGMLQFYGANRTGRWAGRIVQLQNLPQNHIETLDVARQLVKDHEFEGLEDIYGDPAQVFSELVRTAFIPSEDSRFVVSDFSAIEARVIAWLAGEEWRLDVFKNGGDIYCASASMMFKVPVEKHGVNGHLRQRGKVAELALGYGGGVGAMKSMDKGHQIPEEELPGIVKQWREASPKIVDLWRRFEKAATRAVKDKRPESDPVKVRIRDGVRIEFYTAIAARTRCLFVRLPSGRSIAYWGMKYYPEEESGDGLKYWGVGQQSKAWTLLDTYGGKLTENIVQATARDCLAEKMVEATRRGYKIVAHVHDEMIIDVPNEDADGAKTIDSMMAEPIDWAPGLPLKGGTYECPYYQKD
jgi:DNA polymerase